MATYTLPCPYCNYQIPMGSATCPYCYRPINSCPRCRVFVSLGTVNCPRCGEFVAREPRVGAKIWIEGGGIVGDKEFMKVQLENSGNIPTDISIRLEMPSNIEPPSVTDTVRALEPKQAVLRNYQFTASAPGEYIVSKIEIGYTKSSKEMEYLLITPVKFVIYGRPLVQISVDAEPTQIRLGEVAETYITVKNTGSTAALFVKIETAFPTSVQVPDSVMTLPEIKPGEERVANLRIRPLFSGEHVCKVRATYLSPAMGPIASIGFESPVKAIVVNAVVDRDVGEKKGKK